MKWPQFAEDRILIEQLRLIYASTTASIVPMFPAIALLVWILISPTNLTGLLAWAVFVCVSNAYSIYHARRSLARVQHVREARPLARRLMVSVGVGGASWGALAFGALGSVTAAGEILVVFVLSGILGGSVALLAPVLPVFMAFSLPLVGLAVAKLWLLGDASYSAFGVISLMYLGVLMVQTRNSSIATRAAIELRFENLELLRQTEQARLEADQARQQAEQANTAKSKFLAAASHDLRQPIHAQGLFLNVLLHTPLTPEQRELLGNVSAASAASADMLNTLLDFSRVEAGVISPQIQPFKLQDLLNKIEREFEAQADAKGLSYRSRETPWVVQSDPALVEMILRNLVSNAIRYSDTGGLLVACRKRGTHAVLEVWDTGMGIAPENQAEIFKEFHQLGNPERDRRKGLGLGLAIADGLARTLGQRITLASAPGRGSVFRLALPVTQASARLELAHEPAAMGQLWGLQVLVIDDDEAVLQGMAQLLRSWGCEASTAGSISEALALARSQPIAALISDYRLRDQRTGAQAISEIRALLGNKLPALMITGDTGPERLREALGSGVPLLHKPVAPEQLYRALAALLKPA